MVGSRERPPRKGYPPVRPLSPIPVRRPRPPDALALPSKPPSLRKASAIIRCPQRPHVTFTAVLRKSSDWRFNPQNCTISIILKTGPCGGPGVPVCWYYQMSAFNSQFTLNIKYVSLGFCLRFNVCMRRNMQSIDGELAPALSR